MKARLGVSRRMIGSVVVCAAILSLWNVMPHSQLLYARATKVANFSQSELEAFYRWKSGHELLLWRPQYEKEADDDKFYKVDHVLICYDLVTGKEYPLATEEEHADRYSHFPTVSLDGTRLFWTNEPSDTIQILGDLESIRPWETISVPASAQSRILGGDLIRWMNDNRHWIMFEWGKRQSWDIEASPRSLWFGDVQTPTRARCVPIEANSPLADKRVNVFSSVVSSEHRLVVMDICDKDNIVSNLSTYETDPALQGTLLRKYRVRLPMPARIVRAAISPNGDRIAWMLNCRQMDPSLALLSHVFPFLHLKAEDQTSLWVSRLNGEKFQNLGVVYDEKEIPDALQWLPDGQRLSFLNQNTLWTVPTP